MRLLAFVVFAMVCSVVMAGQNSRNIQWQPDAPHAYLVRQSDTEADVIRHFVARVRDWSKVWCPWPGYAPLPVIEPGDLLVQVSINGRRWVQRARRANGDRPHAQVLRAYNGTDVAAFSFRPDPDQPEQTLMMNPSELVPTAPLKPVHTEVMAVWPASDTQPSSVVRLDLGFDHALNAGTALTIKNASETGESIGSIRLLLTQVHPTFSYAVVLDQDAEVAVGDRVHSPTAWCVESAS